MWPNNQPFDYQYSASAKKKQCTSMSGVSDICELKQVCLLVNTGSRNGQFKEDRI